MLHPTTISAIESLLQQESAGSALLGHLSTVHEPVARKIRDQARAAERTVIVGICGAQGSGKTLFAAVLRILLEAEGLRAANLSLDDFYFSRSERKKLAARVHSLLETRGVPGTHDVDLAIRTLDSLCNKGEVSLPAFSKADDDRIPSHAWARIRAPVDVVLFEGWCVGARPQTETALRDPINDLERECDPDGRWRRYVNERLGSDYQALFSRLQTLIFLQAPGFDIVYEWRAEQERKLRERIEREGNSPRTMDDTQLRRFIAHYERLTRHILEEMPARADICIPLDERRRPRIELRIER